MLLATLLLSAATAAAGPVSGTNNVNSTDDVMKQQQIQALEQVKDALYEQLRGAVAESVLALNGSDGGALATLMELPSLKDLMQDPGRLQNSSDAPERRRFDQLIGQKRADEEENVVEEPVVPPGDEPVTIHDEVPMASSHAPTPSPAERDRRAQGIKNAKYWYDFFNLGDVVKLNFNDQGFVQSKIKTKKEAQKTEQELNKKYVIQRLREWMLQKQEEKRKIHEWKMRLNANHELCPRWGMKKKNIYPCCRKCCKASYLGCL